MIVWLWDAPGPARSGSGVSGDQEGARRAAEECLRAGHARAARIEQAVTVIGAVSLVPMYLRTGGAWQARRGKDGIVWERLPERDR